MAEVSVVPLSSRPSIAPVLPTDEIVLSRDGVALLRATISTLFSSPDLSGNPTAPTQSPGNSSTRVANTAFVQSAIGAIGPYQPLDDLLTALSALVTSADKGLYFTGSDAAALFGLTAAGRALLDDADAAAQRATMGILSAALKNIGTSGDSVPVLNGANTHSGVNTFAAHDGLRAQSASPGLWMDETGGTKGCYLALDGGFLNVQRRGAGFGGFEATAFQMDIVGDTGFNALSGKLRQSGTVTTSAILVQFDGTLNSADTDSQYGLYNIPDMQPSGSTLGAVYGSFSSPSISGGAAAITAAYGVFSRVNRTAGFTGSLSVLHNVIANSPQWSSGGPTTEYSSFYAVNPTFPTPAPLETAFRGTFTAATGRWNCYMQGSARNFFAGGLDIGAGATAALRAPIKLTSGAVMSTPEPGAIEYDGQFRVTPTSGARISVGGALTAENSTVANSGSAETTLRSVTLVAAGLNVSGQSLEGHETVEWSNNVNAKVLRVKFGVVGAESTIYTGNITPSASGSARISYVIQRTSASTARCDVSVSSDDTGLKRHAYIEISVDLTAATQLLVTGQGAASSDISARFSKAQFTGS